ncbi:MAG: hypothetical protein P4M08_01395 [Oligoflexia bacterium]|nr:hypothetical protein [Oligoflexia bacterium]
MPNLKIDQIQLLSLKDKRAKKVQFDPKTTVILGDNDVGKSSLIKSIYWGFGATPGKVSKLHGEAEPISLISFRIDQKPYSILRHSDFYSVFDSDNNLLKTFNKVTTGLGPYLASLLNFNLKLVKNDKVHTPPPAFLFLPFYIDQDTGWSDNWCSFSNLKQFPKYRGPVVEYHTGIRPNEYYNLRGDIELHKESILRAEAEYQILVDIHRRQREQLGELNFNVDISAFETEVKELLEECKHISELESAIQEELVSAANARLALESQISIVKKALNEIRSDYEFATELATDPTVACPTCGAEYENDFESRFEIAKDEGRCFELLESLSSELQTVNSTAVAQRKEHHSALERLEKINEILKRKRNEIQLEDVIKSEGRKALRESLKKDIDDKAVAISDAKTKIDGLKEEIKKFENKERKKEIHALYLTKMREYLHELSVQKIKVEEYTKISSKIKQTGSDLPRALLAYYYSILHVTKKYSTAAFCPIVIDSPLQQDPDETMTQKMIKLILSNAPTDSQLILGLVSLHGVETAGKVIEFKDKWNLLSQAEYDDVFAQVNPYLEKSINSAVVT